MIGMFMGMFKIKGTSLELKLYHAFCNAILMFKNKGVRLKRVCHLIWLATIWSLWRLRNQMVF